MDLSHEFSVDLHTWTFFTLSYVILGITNRIPVRLIQDNFWSTWMTYWSSEWTFITCKRILFSTEALLDNSGQFLHYLIFSRFHPSQSTEFLINLVDLFIIWLYFSITAFSSSKFSGLSKLTFGLSSRSSCANQWWQVSIGSKMSSSIFSSCGDQILTFCKKYVAKHSVASKNNLAV